MAVSIRPALTVAVAAFSAGVIASASVVTPMPDTSMARASSTIVSHVAVDYQVATQQLVPSRELSAIISSLSTAQVLDIARVFSTGAVTPTIAPYPPLINLANLIEALYIAIEPWVEYAFEVAAYVVSWIPYGWLISDQIWVLYNFGERLVRSGVFNINDWLRGQGSALKNVADWVVDAGLALVWLGLDELSAIGIPLPPLPIYVPKPPIADVPEGVLGDILVGLSAALAVVSNGIWNIWEPIKGGIGRGVGFISGALDSIAWIPFVPLINFELNEAWTLIASEGDALTGFAHDLINAGNQFVVDSVDGDGLIAATINALNTTLQSIGTRGGQAIQALVDWGRAQLDYFVGLVTPGAASASTEQQATATDSSVRVPAAVAHTFTDGDKSVSFGEAAVNRVALVGGDTVSSDRRVVDKTTIDNGAADSDRHALAPGKTSIDASGKHAEDLTKGLRKPTPNVAKQADKDEPGTTVKKPGADAKKPDNKHSADAARASEKAGSKAGSKAGDE